MLNNRLKKELKEHFRRHGRNSLIYWEDFPSDVKGYDVSEFVHELVKMGAKPKAKLGDRKIAPLHRCNDPQIVAALIKVGADVNAKDYQGYTPLHLCNNAEVAKLLIDAGANVNALNMNGVTPLHFAENVEVARLLINSKANPNVIDNWGRTPADVQLESGDNDVACFLNHYINQFVIRRLRRPQLVQTNSTQGLLTIIEHFYNHNPDLRGELDRILELFYELHPELRGILNTQESGIRLSIQRTDYTNRVSPNINVSHPSPINNKQSASTQGLQAASIRPEADKSDNDYRFDLDWDE